MGLQENPLQALLALLIGNLAAKPVEGFPNLSTRPNGINFEDLEQHQSSPSRIRNKIVVDSAQDFIGYVNRFKSDNSTIFVNPDGCAMKGDLARCVIDYHEAPSTPAAVPHWGDHTVVLRAIPSPEYQLLLAFHNAGVMPQDRFALALRDVARFITSHESADILEVAQTIALTSKGDFKTFEDDFSGSVDFKYDLAVKASAGTTEKRLQVPREISFNVPLLLKGARVEVRAELLYRVPAAAGDKVQLGLRLPDKVWLERDAIEASAAEIAEGTGLMTLVGSLHGK